MTNILDTKPTRTQVPAKQIYIEWLLRKKKPIFNVYATKAAQAKKIASVHIWCVSSMAALD